jgi:hypothetical protein
LTITRIIRLALAIFFLTATTISIVADAHAACDLNTGASDHAGHDHPHPTSSPHHGDEPTTDDNGTADDSAAAGMTCHSNSGCPGCVSAAGPALPSPSATLIAFRPTAENGQSAKPDTQLRPPKFS